MTYETLKPGVSLQSNAVYTAADRHIHVREQDTVTLDDEIYLSVSEYNGGRLKTAFYLNGLENVTLDFSGARLTLHGLIQPFLLDRCKNVVIKNVAVEYERSLCTELEIIENSGGELRLRPLPKFPCRVENGYLIPYGDDWENRALNVGSMWIQAFDTVTCEGAGMLVGVIGEEIRLHETPPCEVNHLKVREENGDIILTGNIPASWDSSMTVVISHELRDISSAFICRSENISFESYRIINGAGMGILGMYTRNLTLDRLILTRDRLSHGIATNCADAVHLISSSGRVVIRDSVIEGMIDDALNIHSNYLEVEEVCGDTLRLLRHRESHFVNAYFQLLGEGDCICVHAGHTLAERCRLTARSVRVLDSYRLEVVADGALSAICAGDLVENLSTQPEVTVENCVFGKANTHLRLQTRGRTLLFGCVSSLPVLLTGDTNYWYESSPCRDLTVTGCTFRGPRGVIRSIPEFVPCKDAPWYHENLRIIGNSFTAENALTAHYTNDIVFLENTHEGDGAPLRISLHDCGRVVRC